jgi:hypothetical protein
MGTSRVLFHGVASAEAYRVLEAQGQSSPRAQLNLPNPHGRHLISSSIPIPIQSVILLHTLRLPKPFLTRYPRIKSLSISRRSSPRSIRRQPSRPPIFRHCRSTTTTRNPSSVSHGNYWLQTSSTPLTFWASRPSVW